MGKYKVETNFCECHPETCCCNDWVLIDPKGNRVTTFFRRWQAKEIADKLNNVKGN